METTPLHESYEQRINTLIDELSIRKAWNSIKGILRAIKTGADDDTTFDALVFNFGGFREALKGQKASNQHTLITYTNLHQYLKTNLFLQLSDSNLIYESRYALRERAIFVVKEILATEVVIRRKTPILEAIETGKLDLNMLNEYDDIFNNASKFRSLYNNLHKEYTERDIPKEYVKEILMVLGFDLDAFRSYALREQAPDSDWVQPSVHESTNKNVFWVASLILASLIIPSSLYFAKYYRGDKEQALEVKSFSRPRISSSKLFSKPYPITSEGIDEGIRIESDTVIFEQALVIKDTVPLDQVWIRIKIANTSTNKVYFPDALIIKTGNVSTKSGTKLENIADFQGDFENLSVELTCKSGSVIEWIIETNDSEEPLMPQTEVYSWIKISGSGNCIMPFWLVFKCHDTSALYYFSSEESFKMAMN